MNSAKAIKLRWAIRFANAVNSIFDPTPAQLRKRHERVQLRLVVYLTIIALGWETFVGWCWYMNGSLTWTMVADAIWAPYCMSWFFDRPRERWFAERAEDMAAACIEYPPGCFAFNPTERKCIFKGRRIHRKVLALQAKRDKQLVIVSDALHQDFLHAASSKMVTNLASLANSVFPTGVPFRLRTQMAAGHARARLRSEAEQKGDA